MLCYGRIAVCVVHINMRDSSADVYDVYMTERREHAGSHIETGTKRPGKKSCHLTSETFSL